MRKFIFAIAILIGIVFVLVNIAEVQSIVDTLKKGDLRFLLLALGVEVLWMLNVAASYRYVYKALGLDERTGRLIMMAAAANFVNVIAPSGGVGGMGVFISEARRNRYSSAKVTVAGALVVMFDYLGFLSVLGLGFVVLFRRNNINSVELFASVFLLLIAIVWGTMLYLGMRSEQTFGRILAKLVGIANGALRPFIRREYLSEERAYAFAHDASAGLILLRQKPINLIIPAFLGLTSKLLLMLILLLLFLAFQVSFSAGTIVAGFSMGYLFYIVSPTPSGIGFMEGALTLGLSSLNVPIGAAAVIALAYRGITFWLPLLVGMLAFRWLGRKKSVEYSA